MALPCSTGRRYAWPHLRFNTSMKCPQCFVFVDEHGKCECGFDGQNINENLRSAFKEYYVGRRWRFFTWGVFFLLVSVVLILSNLKFMELTGIDAWYILGAVDIFIVGFVTHWITKGFFETTGQGWSEFVSEGYSKWRAEVINRSSR